MKAASADFWAGLALGGLGWAGFNLNMFLNVMTPLIMVISFSDSMQLTFAARDRLIAGQSKYEAFTGAIRVVRTFASIAARPNSLVIELPPSDWMA